METKELIVPEFHSREEEAAFWDNLDTADYMPAADDDRWITLEWTERDDRCRRCGGGMDTRHTDLQIAGGRVVLRGAPIYVCRTPGCGNTHCDAVFIGIGHRLLTLPGPASPNLRYILPGHSIYWNICGTYNSNF